MTTSTIDEVQASEDYARYTDELAIFAPVTAPASWATWFARYGAGYPVAS